MAKENSRTTKDNARANLTRTRKPPRPANLAHGRWLGDFPRLNAAEKRLIAACNREEWCVLGLEVPIAPTTANRIRAGLIRFLLLGGDAMHPVHEAGVQVVGGWIEGDLDLDLVKATGRLGLNICRLQAVTTRDARFPVLMLKGSHLKSLSADRMVVTGSVFLSEDFRSEQSVELRGAQIGGPINCRAGRFGTAYENEEAPGAAIVADRAIIKGSAFLDVGFVAFGEVALRATQVGSDLYLGGGIFRGGQSSAISANGLRVSGALFIRNSEFSGKVDLRGVIVGSLVDDGSSWPKNSLLLDGFLYDSIAFGPTSADGRIDWLNRQIAYHLGRDFKPQPWEQVIKVLRDMGHPFAARRIAIEKQRVWRRSHPDRRRHPRWWLHKLYGGLAAYGYRPWWTVGWMAGAALLCSLAYCEGRHDGLFGPTSPPIQLSKALEHCGDGGTPGRIYWTAPNCPMLPEYTSFEPLIYSLDVILPFVNLGQEDAWAPIVSNERGEQLLAGHLLRILIWLEILFGWLTGVLLAAVAGNLVKKD